jgi:hypothetical protein
MERCVDKHIYNFLLENRIISSNQSGFTPGDSAINQLLYITNEFGKALDDEKKVRERPFNLKGWGYVFFFFFLNILIPNVAEKNILILVEKKKSDSEFLSYNLMLKPGKKIF